MTDKKVDVGVLEEKDAKLLHPRFYPSKVGGKPAWLGLRDLPNPKDLTCKICCEQLVFLCQVYAPVEEIDECFHRTIFVFICKNGSCCKTNCNENLKVFRCQLPRKNDFYSFQPYNEENKDEEFPMDTWSKLCAVCGIKAPSHCSKCKNIYYCSRKHQIIDWQKSHKENCQSGKKSNCLDFIVTDTGKSLLFKEWELIVDEEDEEEAIEVDVNQEMSKLKKMMQDKKAGTLSNISDKELEEYTGTISEDKFFDKFSKRIARHPDQVLRYDRGGVPLWITGSGSQINVAKCNYCNEERQYEFQIMPQLLNFINVGLDLDSIDWGILIVYTCKSSCNEGPAYKEEFIIKQDLSS